jgi:hypothetical protein
MAPNAYTEVGYLAATGATLAEAAAWDEPWGDDPDDPTVPNRERPAKLFRCTICELGYCGWHAGRVGTALGGWRGT